MKLVYDMYMKIVAIDPSIRKLGFAQFNINKKKKTATLECAELYKVTGNDWIECIDEMIRNLLYPIRNAEIVLIELPHIYTVGKRGVAAGNSESIMKLCAFVFALRQHLIENDQEVILIPVAKWKGQVPKSITKKRIKKRWNFTHKSNDVVDACGVGDYYIKKVLGIVTVQSKI